MLPRLEGVSKHLNFEADHPGARECDFHTAVPPSLKVANYYQRRVLILLKHTQTHRHTRDARKG